MSNFKIPSYMKKIIDVTLSAENFSTYTNVVFTQNSMFISGLNLTKEWIIRIDVTKDSEWTSSSKPNFFLFDKATGAGNELMRSMTPDVSSDATKCIIFCHGNCVDDSYYYHGAFFNNQYHMADVPTKNEIGYQDKSVIDGIRLSFGSFTPTIGTRIRIYAD